jgi:hypothetical protein
MGRNRANATSGAGTLYVRQQFDRRGGLIELARQLWLVREVIRHETGTVSFKPTEEVAGIFR